MPPEEYGDDFTSNIASEIWGELFAPSVQATKAEPTSEGTGENSIPAENAVSPKTETKPVEPPQTPAIVQGQNSPIKPLPKSWKKDMAPLWEKMDPAIHEYVYSREADVMRGIQSYQESAKKWQELLQPYAPIFEQHTDVNPIQLMQGLMNTHLQLLNPGLPQEQKLQMAKQLLADYGIDLGQTPIQGVDPRVLNLEARLAEFDRQAKLREKAAFDAGVAEQTRMVETFAKDPKNKYFDEVGNDIFRFIQTGAATDLQSAYELACYANPAVRAKILAEQQAPAPTVPAKRNEKGQFVNVEGQEVQVRPRKGSIDDTITNIINSHYSAH